MADRYFVDGGVDNNWGTSGNWSASSGGAGGESVPTNSDDVFFDANSPNCVLDTSARTCRALDFTGYTNTITFNQLLTANGSITLAAAMTFAGTSALECRSTGTLTSNGKTVNIPLTLGGVSTQTLADDWTVSGLLTIGVPGVASTFNGNTFQIQGSCTIIDGGYATGTTVFTFVGTGTWSGNTEGRLKNVVINTAGTLTIGTGVSIESGTLTYVAGTVITTGSTLKLRGNTTLDCAAITWNDVTLFTATATLSDDLNVSGTLRVGVNSVGTSINGNQILLTGSLIVLAGSYVGGTTEIVFTGTGSWSAESGGRLRVPVIINTAGTLTISGTVNYSTSTLTYTAGTLASSSGILNIFEGTATILDMNGATIPFNLQITTANVILNLASTVIIASTSGINFQGTAGNLVGIRSNSTPTQRKLTVTAGASINVRFNNATDIDSGDGVPVTWRKPGSTTNTINWLEIAGGTGAGKGNKGNKGGGGVNIITPGSPVLIGFNPAVDISST